MNQTVKSADFDVPSFAFFPSPNIIDMQGSLSELLVSFLC